MSVYRHQKQNLALLERRLLIAAEWYTTNVHVVVLRSVAQQACRQRRNQSIVRFMPYHSLMSIELSSVGRLDEKLYMLERSCSRVTHLNWKFRDPGKTTWPISPAPAENREDNLRHIYRKHKIPLLLLLHPILNTNVITAFDIHPMLIEEMHIVPGGLCLGY